jgi:protein ImuB
MLMRERMERLVLPAPVLEIELSAARLVPLQQSTTDLFGAVDSEGDDLQTLLERLRARLGDEAVQGIYPVSEHRPELAWRYGAPGETSDTDSDRQRPLWLLPQPVPLKQKEGRPWLHGVLSLQPDRERIESGWWDGHDLRRDYFIARDRFQARYWVYRQLDPSAADSGWYLHGIFE